MAIYELKSFNKPSIDVIFNLIMIPQKILYYGFRNDLPRRNEINCFFLLLFFQRSRIGASPIMIFNCKHCSAINSLLLVKPPDGVGFCTSLCYFRWMDKHHRNQQAFIAISSKEIQYNKRA